MAMGHMEEIAVRLADTLPCPMLLGIDWAHLCKVVGKTMKSDKEEKIDDQRDMVFIGISTEEASQSENLNAELDLEEVIGDRQFRERKRQEPIFQNIYKEILAK